MCKGPMIKLFLQLRFQNNKWASMSTFTRTLKFGTQLHSKFEFQIELTATMLPHTGTWAIFMGYESKFDLFCSIRPKYYLRPLRYFDRCTSKTLLHSMKFIHTYSGSCTIVLRVTLFDSSTLTSLRLLVYIGFLIGRETSLTKAQS